MTDRRIIEAIAAHPSRDGAGVAIQRVAAMQHAGIDPLLMVDELRSEHREDFAAGFPPHPHRGMQTLTYMKHGGIVHEDSLGNRGEIRSGGAQWMSAGRGVIHSEMPTQDTYGLHGFQLWVNLPAKLKMIVSQRTMTAHVPTPRSLLVSTLRQSRLVHRPTYPNIFATNLRWVGWSWISRALMIRGAVGVMVVPNMTLFPPSTHHLMQATMKTMCDGR